MAKKADGIKGAVKTVQLLEMPNGGSDITLKKNIVEVASVLERVLSLRPVTWNWKTDKDGAPIKYGFIAQEVERLFPDLVEEKEWVDGTQRKYLSTNDMLPYLVAAIKEQQEQILELRQRLASAAE